jgi:hypothetical protein
MQVEIWAAYKLFVMQFARLEQMFASMTNGQILRSSFSMEQRRCQNDQHGITFERITRFGIFQGAEKH